MSTQRPPGTWQEVRDEVLSRIHDRRYAPGDTIPNEAELAAEFGCARATVNRALRALADTGLIERRRRAGTRVALHPVRQARLAIPLIRAEIEARGARYGYRLLQREEAPPPAGGPTTLRDPALHLVSLHLADDAPVLFEDRWIDLATVPAARAERFTESNPNEWLVANAPYTRGELVLSAAGARDDEASALSVARGTPLFIVERTTWDHGHIVTHVRQAHAPGYRMKTDL